MKFFKALVLVCALGFSLSCALRTRDVQDVYSGFAILQGPTSSSQTRILVQAPKNLNVIYLLKDSSSQTTVIKPERTLVPQSSFALDRLDFFGLKLGKKYHLLIKSGDETLEQREFTTLDLNKKLAKIAVASCMDDLHPDQRHMWLKLLEQNPDALFLIGDNVYADHGTGSGLERIFRRYSETRERLGIFRSLKLIPTFAIWDDHDYGMNDSDRTFEFKKESLSNFLNYFPQSLPTEGFTRGPGVSSLWEAFGVNFVFLDNRSFRSPNGLDTPDQTHFGPEQEQWILDILMKTKKPSFFISGDQFFGEYTLCESYQSNQPKSFQEQLKKWRTSKGPIAFISGDRHLAVFNEVSQEYLGYKTAELTTSAIHAKVYKDSLSRCPSANPIATVQGELNYMILQLDKVSSKGLGFSASVFGKENKLYFKNKFVVKK